MHVTVEPPPVEPPPPTQSPSGHPPQLEGQVPQVASAPSKYPVAHCQHFSNLHETQ